MSSARPSEIAPSKLAVRARDITQGYTSHILGQAECKLHAACIFLLLQFFCRNICWCQRLTVIAVRRRKSPINTNSTPVYEGTILYETQIQLACLRDYRRDALGSHRECATESARLKR